MFDGKFRQRVDAGIAPLGRGLNRLGFSADVLTTSGLVFAVATGWAIARDYFWWAILLLIVTGVHDLLDGAVAKASARANQRGSFFDSVVDRISDAALLGGVAYWIEVHHPGALVLLPFGLVTTFFIISYERSKAESLGIAAKGGLMERAERLVLIGLALSNHRIFIPVLWVLLALTTMTAVGRFYRVWQQAAFTTAAEGVQNRRPRRATRDTPR
jgi:CDP-diacylglycerol--glycerol-3-phosphate 3-phosphatidyltransferase